LLHYSSRYDIPLPEKDKISDLVDRSMAIVDKMEPLTATSSDELLQSDKKKESDDNETEPSGVNNNNNDIVESSRDTR
ncbi:MAG: hypothetical protein ACRD5B_11365, partial [Nitrososphaeraceae archaeon]